MACCSSCAFVSREATSLRCSSVLACEMRLVRSKRKVKRSAGSCEVHPEKAPKAIRAQEILGKDDWEESRGK